MEHGLKNYVKQSVLFIGLWGMLLLLGVGLQGCQAPKEELPGAKYLVLVELTASDCGDCAAIHQIIQNLKPLYEKKLNFITLDVSNPISKVNAQDKAHDYHAGWFVKRYQAKPATVGIIHIPTGEAIEVVEHNTEEARYIKMIDAAIAKAHGH